MKGGHHHFEAAECFWIGYACDNVLDDVSQTTIENQTRAFCLIRNAEVVRLCHLSHFCCVKPRSINQITCVNLRSRSLYDESSLFRTDSFHLRTDEHGHSVRSGVLEKGEYQFKRIKDTGGRHVQGSQDGGVHMGFQTTRLAPVNDFEIFDPILFALLFQRMDILKFLLVESQNQFAYSCKLDVKILYHLIPHPVAFSHHSLGQGALCPACSRMADRVTRLGLTATDIRLFLNEHDIELIPGELASYGGAGDSAANDQNIRLSRHDTSFFS